MYEFNPDGSIKLPENLAKKNENMQNRMRNTKCIQIEKRVVSFTSPKKCNLSLTLSDKIYDFSFIENVFKYFLNRAETQFKLNKISNKEFEIEVGTSFKRCSECNQLVVRLRNAVDFNIFEKEGTCTSKKKEFCYEDYFE